MSHSAKKCRRVDPLGFFNILSVAKYQKPRKGDPLVLSGFVGYVKKVLKNESGPFALSLLWPDMASVCVVLVVSA